MTSISHEPSGALHAEQRWSTRLFVPEMWAFLAIAVMWLSVLFTAVWGPDLVSTNGVGAGDIGERTTVPSAIFVALFAFLATWVVARHGFGRGPKHDTED